MDLAARRERYIGREAAQYEARRARGEKWRREEGAVAHLISEVPAGSRLLDIPVGTGRFLKLYSRHGLAVTGIDVSGDMIAQAERSGVYGASLSCGSAFDIPLADGGVDVAVCVRFLNWLRLDELHRVLAELSRVTRGRIICGVRLTDSGANFPSRIMVHHVRKFDAALDSVGWRIADAIEIERDRRGLYSMLRLGRL